MWFAAVLVPVVLATIGLVGLWSERERPKDLGEPHYDADAPGLPSPGAEVAAMDGCVSPEEERQALAAALTRAELEPFDRAMTEAFEHLDAVCAEVTRKLGVSADDIAEYAKAQEAASRPPVDPLAALAAVGVHTWAGRPTGPQKLVQRPSRSRPKRAVAAL